MQLRKRDGFTLIEVMVALVIVSIGMLAVIQAVSQSANNGAYLRDKTIAQWVALNQLTLMRIDKSSPPLGERSGEAEMAGQRWRWKAEVIKTAVASMLRIDVSVRMADAEEGSQLAAVTGFYGERNAKPGILIEQFILAPSAATDTSQNGGSSGGGKKDPPPPPPDPLPDAT